MLRILISIILLTTLWIPKVSYATYNNISGTYSGTISFQDVNGTPGPCPSPGNFTGTLTITLVGDDSGNITGGSGQFVNNSNAEVDTVSSITGTNDNTNFTIGFFASGDPGSLTGTFTNNSITISIGNVNSTDCDSININGTLSKTSGGTTVISSATPSSTVLDAILFNTQVQGTINDISSRIGAALNSLFGSIRPSFTDNQFKLKGATGLNAGDGISIPYGVWGNYAYTDYENDLSTTAFDGTSHSFLGGIDFSVKEDTIIGLALGFEKSDIDTTFNSGNQDTNSFTIAPYAGLLLNDTFSIDLNFGYSRVNYDQFRTVGVTKITSSPDANRWFSAFNINAIKFIDRWVIGGRIGTIYASSEINSFTESNGIGVEANTSKAGTASIAGNIAYSFNHFEPFLNLSYQYDFSFNEVISTNAPQPENDRDDILLTSGVRFFEDSGISGNLEYSKRLSRADFSEDRISLTVRVDF